MASLKERIKELSNKRHITVAELERTLNFANGSISKWDKQSPSAERLQKVAEYFSVSTDYLLGRTDTPSFTAKDELDIHKVVDDMINGLSNKNSLAFLKNNGSPVDEDDAELLKLSLENVARQSLLLSRKRERKNNDK